MNWDLLRELRSRFLSETVQEGPDYWKSREHLEAYDATFAQRIGWKWDAVLRDPSTLAVLKGTPYLLEWGCGTGVATRKVLGKFPGSFQKVQLWDRSLLAREYARDKIGGVSVEIADPAKTRPEKFVLLLSHVLGEIADAPDWVMDAEAILWVEPGTPELSRRLVDFREKARERFGVIAPCPHQSRCGMLDAAPHWCHFFAEPPSEVFQSKAWSEFSRKLGIDLRSLPVSYLVLAKTEIASTKRARVLGRPRLHGGFAEVLACEESGIRDRKILKRENAELFKTLKRGGFSRLVD